MDLDFLKNMGIDKAKPVQDKITFQDLVGDEWMWDYDFEGHTFQDFMNDFDFTGEIMIGKAEKWNEHDRAAGMTFEFYCGPSIGDGYVSDTVRIDGYVQKICDELNLDAEIGAAENYHWFNTNDLSTANKMYTKLKRRIAKDFPIDEYKNNL